MKRVLITGANSYVGTSVEKWLIKDPSNYHVETLDMQNPSWVNFDFSKFDVVFHVAGIVHLNEKNIEGLYYKVNRDLVLQTAEKSKQSQVKHFIFMSSMSVFGIDKGKICTESSITPFSNYGKSKREAEELLLKIKDDSFKISIIRAPMIYGKNCPGNFSKLSIFAKKTPIFTKTYNKRGVLHIRNLCYFVESIIDFSDQIFYHPQNKDLISTSDMISAISKFNNRKILLVPIIGYILKYLPFKNIRKIYQDLYYDETLSNPITFVNFKESLYLTENND